MRSCDLGFFSTAVWSPSVPDMAIKDGQWRHRGFKVRGKYHCCQTKSLSSLLTNATNSAACQCFSPRPTCNSVQSSWIVKAKMIHWVWWAPEVFKSHKWLVLVTPWIPGKRAQTVFLKTKPSHSLPIKPVTTISSFFLFLLLPSSPARTSGSGLTRWTTCLVRR